MLYPQRGGLPCTGSPPWFSRDAAYWPIAPEILQNTFLTWLPRMIRTTITTTAIKTRMRAYSTMPCPSSRLSSARRDRKSVVYVNSHVLFVCHSADPVRGPPCTAASLPAKDCQDNGEPATGWKPLSRARKKKESLLLRGSSLLFVRIGLLAETARDVAEDVLHLVAQDDQDHDNDHRDQDQDEGVLYHALPFLTVEQRAETKIEAGQHALHLLCDVMRRAAQASAIASRRHCTAAQPQIT